MSSYQAWAARRAPQGATARGEGILDVNRPSVVERQRRLTPFTPFDSQNLLPTDPVHLSWSDGSLQPFQEKIVEGEWELMVHAGSTDANGWNYAFNWEFVFHPKATAQDFVRKRIWVRRRHDAIEELVLPRLPDSRSAAGLVGCVRVLPVTGTVDEGAAHGTDVECMHALFGQAGEVDGALVWAQPATAHEELLNQTQLCGNIAIVQRDTPGGELSMRKGTGFVDKTFRAAAAGARAVIIVNYADELLAPWKSDHDLMDAGQILVPVVCVRGRDEEALLPGAWCQLSFNPEDTTRDMNSSDIPKSRASKGLGEGDGHGGGRIAGEWEWAADSDDYLEIGEESSDEEEAGKTWLEQSKLLMQENARCLSERLASNSAYCLTHTLCHRHTGLHTAAPACTHICIYIYILTFVGGYPRDWRKPRARARHPHRVKPRSPKLTTTTALPKRPGVKQGGRMVWEQSGWRRRMAQAGRARPCRRSGSLSPRTCTKICENCMTCSRTI